MRAWLLGAGVLAALSLASTALSQGEDEPLTLAQAIAEALESNPRLAIARAGVRAARGRRMEARAGGRPSVDLNSNQRAQQPEVNIGQAKPSPIPGAPPELVDKILNPTYAIEPQLQMLYPLFNGGRVQAQKRAAGRGARAAQARVAAEEQRLVLDVTSSYLDVLEARRQVELTGALRTLDVERLRVAQLRQRTGVGVILEVSQTEADLAQSVQREILATSRVRSVGATLNTLVGRPAGAKLVVVDLPATVPTEPPPAAATLPPTAEELVELGLERPDLRALREETRQAEAQVNIARAARRPQVNLFQNYLRRIPATILGVYSWQLGATLVQSLFDGGRARAQVVIARAERARRTAVLNDAERRVEEQVEQSQAALEAAEQRLEAEAKRVVAAEAALDVARRRLRAGTAARIEVTEAETVLARAQNDALDARFELARARVNLAFVAGMAYPETISNVAAAAPR